MKIARILAGVATLFALATAATAEAQPSRTDPYQWRLENSAGQNVTYPGNGPYRLVNERVGEPLCYGRRTWGVNLVWGCDRPAQWFFFRAITYRPYAAGDPVAMWNTHRTRTLFSATQDFGINLSWTSTKLAQWELRERNGHYALYNRYVSDYLMNAWRAFGINLRWARDIN